MALKGSSDERITALRTRPFEDGYADEPALHSALARIEAIGATFSGRGPELGGPDRRAPGALGRLGRYELLEHRGQGGMGTVYKARHTMLNRVVAVKVLPADRTHNPNSVARFQREMQAVGKLNHPNIVRAVDADEDSGTHYLVMELVEGVDLSELVRRRGRLPIAEACELIRQTALGLQHAYENGLIHRDIKPSNLMLATDGTLKVLGPGLARLWEDAPGGPELTVRVRRFNSRRWTES